MKISIKQQIAAVAILILALSMTSCVTPRQILYLQDMDQNSQIEVENKFEARISPNDELQVLISSQDKELSRPFNLSSSDNLQNSNYSKGYLVDVNGNIELPILGKIYVAGKTRLQLQEEIKEMLLQKKYMEDPYVMVRFLNYKIFFLGSDGGKAITIPEERCTFLEALALSGDLDMFTRRDKIAVLREVDGKMTMRYLDPRNSQVFNDPYYMLQQNDIILTQSTKSKYTRDQFSYWASWLSLIASLASIGTLIAILVPGVRPQQ